MSRVKNWIIRVTGWRNRRLLMELKRRIDAFRIRRKGSSSIKTLMIDVTYKCTLSCVTCNVPHIEKSAYKDRHNLNVAEIAILLHDFKRIGGKNLSVSGGEPFLHPEIGSVLAMAKGMGFQVTVTSNHTIMTETNAKYVADYVDQLIFSLDGPSQEVNDVIRGKNAFKRAIEGRKTIRRVLEEMNKEWVADRITCTISKYNYKTMPQMVELAKSIGIKHIYFNYLSIVPDSIDKINEEVTKIKRYSQESHWLLDQSLLIPHDQVAESCKYADEAKIRGKKLGVVVLCDCAFDGKHNESITTGKFKLTKTPACNSFWDKIGVLPDGSYILCEMMQHYPIANLQEHKLIDVLAHSSRVRMQKLMEDKWLPICSYCCTHSKFSK